MTNELTAPEKRLSLWDIEAGWLPLIEAREAAEDIADPAERAAAIADADVALAEHASREVAKVDGYIGMIRSMEAVELSAGIEERRQQARKRTARAIIDGLKAAALHIMQETGQKRIAGKRGTLMMRGNGGVQPLRIADESLLPDDCCRMEGWISADIWKALHRDHGIPDAWFSLKRVPDTAAIREKLSEPCPRCEGEDSPGTREFAWKGACTACSGSGLNAVPGAFLESRGAHIEVR